MSTRSVRKPALIQARACTCPVGSLPHHGRCFLAEAGRDSPRIFSTSSNRNGTSERTCSRKKPSKGSYFPIGTLPLHILYLCTICIADGKVHLLRTTATP